MFLSAWQRGGLRLRWSRIQTWPRHLIGGTLMGPGGIGKVHAFEVEGVTS